MPLSTLYIRGVFFLLGGKLLPLQGDRLASINNPGWCPGLGASALSGRTVYIGASVLSGHAVYIGASVLSGRAVYIGASVLSGRAAIRLRNFLLHEFCVKFIKKKHGNDGYCKYFVTFALDYENMN
mgnify:FL=1